jgi:hypothetical protein
MGKHTTTVYREADVREIRVSSHVRERTIADVLAGAIKFPKLKEGSTKEKTGRRTGRR